MKFEHSDTSLELNDTEDSAIRASNEKAIQHKILLDYCERFLRNRGMTAYILDEVQHLKRAGRSVNVGESVKKFSFSENVETSDKPTWEDL